MNLEKDNREKLFNDILDVSDRISAFIDERVKKFPLLCDFSNEKSANEAGIIQKLQRMFNIKNVYIKSTIRKHGFNIKEWPAEVLLSLNQIISEQELIILQNFTSINCNIPGK